MARNVVAVLLLGGVLALGCWRQAGPVGGAKVWDRADFKAAVEGKSQTEVESLLGKPDKTSETGGVVRWDYHQRTRDPVTGKTDASADVFFDKSGHVKSVNF